MLLEKTRLSIFTVYYDSPRQLPVVRGQRDQLFLQSRRWVRCRTLPESLRDGHYTICDVQKINAGDSDRTKTMQEVQPISHPIMNYLPGASAW